MAIHHEKLRWFLGILGIFLGIFFFFFGDLGDFLGEFYDLTVRNIAISL